jgi:hypothetical protein
MQFQKVFSEWPSITQALQSTVHKTCITQIIQTNHTSSSAILFLKLYSINVYRVLEITIW